MKKSKILFKIILIAATIAILLPLVVIVLWSFSSNWAWPDLLPGGFSTRGIEELFGGYSGAMQALTSSIVIGLIVAAAAVVIGMMTARALTFYEFKGKRFIEFSSMLPLIVPVAAFAMGLQVLFIKIGLADTVIGVILVHLICALPYTIKIMTDITALWGGKLEQQARVLGASGGAVLRNVTLPVLMPGIISSACMAYIISFSQYFLTLIVGGGSVRTFAIMMVPYLQSGDRTVASAYALVFVVSTLLVFLLFEKMIKKFCKTDGQYFVV